MTAAKLTVVPTAQFKKDLKRIEKRGYDMQMLRSVLERLSSCEQLDPKNRDHALSGMYEGFRECHIKPDWLLIYAADEDRLILTTSRTGTHSDLFGK